MLNQMLHTIFRLPELQVSGSPLPVGPEISYN